MERRDRGCPKPRSCLSGISAARRRIDALLFQRTTRRPPDDGAEDCRSSTRDLGLSSRASAEPLRTRARKQHQFDVQVIRPGRISCRCRRTYRSSIFAGWRAQKVRSAMGNWEIPILLVVRLAEVSQVVSGQLQDSVHVVGARALLQKAEAPVSRNPGGPCHAPCYAAPAQSGPPDRSARQNKSRLGVRPANRCFRAYLDNRPDLATGGDQKPQFVAILMVSSSLSGELRMSSTNRPTFAIGAAERFRLNGFEFDVSLCIQPFNEKKCVLAQSFEAGCETLR